VARVASWLRALSRAAACLRSPGVMTSAPVFLFFWRRQAAEATKNGESNVRGGPAFVPMVVSGDAPAAPVVKEATPGSRSRVDAC
jgi:hypothetical protein